MTKERAIKWILTREYDVEDRDKLQAISRIIDGADPWETINLLGRTRGSYQNLARLELYVPSKDLQDIA